MSALSLLVATVTAPYFIARVAGGGIPYQNDGPYTVKLHKHTLPLHSADGIVQHKSAYFGDVNVGGPQGQPFEVVFDTGSGHLVVPSAVCKSDTCRKHRRYKRKSSAYAEDIDGDGTVVVPGQPRDQITVSFGTGQVTGIFVRDLMCLGKPADPRTIQATSLMQVNKGAIGKGQLPVEDGEAPANATSPSSPTDPNSGTGVAPAAGAIVDRRQRREHGCLSMHLIAATKMSEDPFSEFPFDGVLGLGLHALSQTPDFSFTTKGSLPDTGAWSGRPENFQRTFSVFLAVSPNEDSEITFGGYDPSHMEKDANFIWNNVQDTELGYWQIEIKSITADGEKLDYCDDGACRAIVDTGTSLVAVPSNIGGTLVGKLRHMGTAGMGCSGPGPILEFDLGGIVLKLEPKDMARPEVTLESSNTTRIDTVQIAKREVGSTSGISESATLDAVMSKDNSTATACVPMLMHMDLPSPLHPKTFIFGEPILQQYYTAFDIGPETPRVGFSPAVHVAPREALRILT